MLKVNLAFSHLYSCSLQLSTKYSFGGFIDVCPCRDETICENESHDFKW